MSIIFKEENEQDLCSYNTISTNEKNKVLSNLNKMPMTFITNMGQTDSKVRYYAKGGNFGFCFTEEEVVLSFVKRTPNENFNKDHLNKSDISKEDNEVGAALALQFIEANPDVKVEGMVKSSGKVNYFKGNDQEK